MSSEPVQWLPAIVALSIGAVMGLVMLIRATRGRAVAAGEADLALRDAEAEKETLLAQLREWNDRGAATLSAGASEERLGIEIRAAQALRAIDAMTAPRAGRPRAGGIEPRDTNSVEPRRASPWLGFAAGLASVAVVAAVVHLALGNSEDRAGAAATQPPAAAAPMLGMELPDIAPLESAVTADPENVELRLELARQLLVRDRLMEVYAHTQHILRTDPDEPRALSYQALVRLAMGEAEEALAMLDRALAADPNLLDAYVHKALVFATTHRHEEAAAVIAEASARYPAQKPQLEALLVEMSHGH